MIHPTAIIDPSAQIDRNVTIWSNAIIGAKVIILKDCCIGSNCYVGKGSFIGAGSRLQHGVFLPNNSMIKSQVFIGPNVTFTDDRHPRVGNQDYEAEPPTLEDFCSIGAGATILPGVHIGRGAMVGAGAVVTHDVESYITVIGCPAIPLSTVKCPKDKELKHLMEVVV